MAESLKREAINALESMPEGVVMDDIMYRLYVLDKVKKGLKELDMGNFFVSEDIKKDIESW
jgi:predicted transcriptional regulator